MNFLDISYTFLMLFLVLGIFLVSIFGFQFFHKKITNPSPTLNIKETLYLDNKRRIIVIEKENSTVALFLGQIKEFIIPFESQKSESEHNIIKNCEENKDV